MAEVCDALGLSDQTEPMYLRALAICEKDPDQDKSAMAIILTNLASLYAKQGSLEQAEQLCQRALEIWNDMSGLLLPKPADSASTLEVLAAVYRQTGRDEKAASLEKRAAPIRARKK